MKIILKLIGIQIILAVEIPCRNIFRIDYRIERRKAHLPVHNPVHINRADPAGLSAADIVDMSPEGLRKAPVLRKPGNVPHKAPRVAVRHILEHIIEAVVELDRIADLRHCGTDDARLSEADPVFQSALDDHPLRGDLRDRVVVIHARLDRIADPSPVDRRHPVSGLRDRSDRNKPRRLLLMKLPDRPDEISRGPAVDLHRLLRVVIRKRRDKCSDMQHNVAVLHELLHRLIIREVPVRDRKSWVAAKRLEVLSALFARKICRDNAVGSVILRHLTDRLDSHAAGSSGDQHLQVLHLSFSFHAEAGTAPVSF